MQRSWTYWMVLFGLAFTMPFLAAAELSGDASAVNRRLLERWRGDPEHMARLQRDLPVFRGLPADKQEKLRKLDHDLQAKDSVTQTRLWRVLHRYAEWLERLPEPQRSAIEGAETPAERLKKIRELRDQEWLGRLPRAVHERIEKEMRQASPEEKAQIIAKARKTERERRLDWPIPPRWLDESRGKKKAD